MSALSSTGDSITAPHEASASAGALVKRHRLSTRVWHWINAVAVIVMLMSGLMIFNAHPRLYWGHYGANQDPAWLEIGSTPTTGFVQLGATRIDTTGVLGRWNNAEGVSSGGAFPYWAPIPSGYSLSAARRWHLAFAWIFGLGILLYWIVSLINRHIQRDLAPTREELAPRHIWRDIVDHARLRYPTGEAALRYNILQKIAYGSVIFLLVPLLVLTGLTMSPQMDAAWPWLLDLFGGRQSARSIHFLLAAGMVVFILIHLIQVVLAGPFNETRSIVTGWFRVKPDKLEDTG